MTAPTVTATMATLADASESNPELALLMMPMVVIVLGTSTLAGLWAAPNVVIQAEKMRQNGFNLKYQACQIAFEQWLQTFIGSGSLCTSYV